jgi:hypothetical protein
MKKGLFFIICGIVIGYHICNKKEENKKELIPLNASTEIVEVKNGAITKLQDNIDIINQDSTGLKESTKEESKKIDTSKTKEKYNQVINEYNQYKTDAMSLWQRINYYKSKILRILK